MKIIIATANTKFARDLKEQMQSLDVTVVEIVSCLEDLLESLQNHQDIDGILLKTDLSKKLQDPRLYYLSDVILSIRKNELFEKINFTILADFKAGHPFLAELVDNGVYSIFERDADNISVPILVETLRKPLSFSMAAKYRKVDPDIVWRRDLVKTETVRIEFANSDSSQQSENVSDTGKANKENSDSESNKKGFNLPIPKLNLSIPKFKKDVKPEDINRSLEEPNESIEDEEPVFITEQPKVEQVVGTVLIGVASVAEHLGATNYAINTAKYLSEIGHSVALVEGNESLDFDRIHSLLEGVNAPLKTPEFEYEGIHHIKYRADLDLSRVFTNYDYVVMDVGYIKDSPYITEFRRSHVKCVIASADEWKFHWVEEFLLSNASLDDINFLIPCGSKDIVKDFKSRVKKYEVHSIPQQLPYKTTNEGNELHEYLLSKYQISKAKLPNKIIILTSLVSVAITAFIFFMFT